MAFTSGQILTAAQLNTFDPGTKVTNAGGTAGAPSYTFNGDTDTGMFRSAADSVSFATAGTARLTIDSAGEVGIGTTSPGEPLHIVTASGDAYLKQENGTATTFLGPDSSNTGLFGTSSNHDVRFITNNSERLRIDTSGDASMAGHLTAQSGGADSGIVLGQAFSTDYVGLRTAGMSETSADEYILINDGTITLLSAGTGGDVYIRAGANNSSCQIFLDTSENKIGFTGAVGIGTNSPAGNFQVETQGRAFTIIDSGVTNHAEAAFTTLGGDSPAFSILSAYDFDFQTGTSRGGLTSRMTITSGGDINMDSGTLFVDASTNEVGIGDTVPDAKLHVNSGNTNTTSIFESTDSTAYIGIKDNSSSGNIYVGVGAVGDELRLRAGNSNHLHLESTGTLENVTNNFYASASGKTFVASNPTTGTGNDAEWAAPFGIYVLQRNSSLTAEKENITADLGTHLTASMIDSVVPKMWNRLHAPGYPEIGPLAEDMDAISPFLAAHGTDADGEQILTGINKTAYLSLLVLAVKDLRSRVATLEAA